MAGPRTRVEPAKGFPYRQLTDDVVVQSLWRDAIGPIDVLYVSINVTHSFSTFLKCPYKFLLMGFLSASRINPARPIVFRSFNFRSRS